MENWVGAVFIPVSLISEPLVRPCSGGSGNVFCLLSVRCDLCVCVDDAETGRGGGIMKSSSPK